MSRDELQQLRRQCESDPSEWWPPSYVLPLLDEIERLNALLAAQQADPERVPAFKRRNTIIRGF